MFRTNAYLLIYYGTHFNHLTEIHNGSTEWYQVLQGKMRAEQLLAAQNEHCITKWADK